MNRAKAFKELAKAAEKEQWPPDQAGIT